MEHYPHRLPSVSSELSRRGQLQIPTGYAQFSAGCLVEPCQERQKSALARTAVAFQNHQLTSWEVKIDVVDPHHLASAQLINPGELPRFDL